MNMQIRREYILLTAILVAIAAVVFLIPRVENIGTISSSEVDQILYARLNEYERVYNENLDLNRIVTEALTNPAKLTHEDRQIYLMHERKFLAGWEAAFTYATAGHFDADRFEVWDAWYISELKRRPLFAWAQNKVHYSDSFVRHVDTSLSRH